MQVAAFQILPRPDSAVSTPPSSSASACVVRSMRSRTCGDATVSATSAIAPNANTANSFFQPNKRQPENTSTKP